MKLKIVEAGWEGFSGNLGMVDFENGVSVRDVTHIEANIISGNIRVQNFEDESPVGAIGMDADIQNRPCVTSNLKTMEEIFAEQNGETQVQAPVQTQSETKQYTQEELEQIADKKGIAGLREIAEAMDVRATSIAKLIAGILSKQAPAEPNVAPLQDGQPDVVTSEQAQ